MPNSHSPAIIYLHGLASSPQSAKAALFRDRCAKCQIDFVAPDLNQPAFRSVTLARCINATIREIESVEAQRPLILVGSSFGALTALHTYNRCKHLQRIKALILLAPAFDFLKNKEMRPSDLERWKATGNAIICHNNLPLDFGIITDLAQYDSYQVPVSVPCLVIHGRNDQTIGFEQSERFKSVNPQVLLELCDDTHELKDSFPKIWDVSNVGFVPQFLKAIGYFH